MDKEIKNEETKPYELLAQIFGTTPEELLERANKHRENNNNLAESIESLSSVLSPRERDILRLRFGIDDGRRRTLAEVGELFGVDAERIRQIESNVLKKLREVNVK